jgi:protein-disulfide isomerase-like protein with CxxC motif
VAYNSGLPFDRYTLQTRPLRVLDHEPACRAIAVAARLAPPSAVLTVFRALQHAHFVASLDVGDGSVLANLCAAVLADQGVAIDAPGFHALWSGFDAIKRTRDGFAMLRALGIRSCPTLLLDTGAELVELSAGYAHEEVLEMRLAAHAAPAKPFLTSRHAPTILSL